VFSSDKAGLNATFYDDRLNACTSIFGEMRMRLLSVLFSTRRCCCTLLDVVVVRELYIYIYIYIMCFRQIIKSPSDLYPLYRNLTLLCELCSVRGYLTFKRLRALLTIVIDCTLRCRWPLHHRRIDLIRRSLSRNTARCYSYLTRRVNGRPRRRNCLNVNARICGRHTRVAARGMTL